MSCSRFEDRLERLIDGTLDARERDEAERHLESCPRCRDLLALAQGDLDLSVPPPGGEAALTAAILRSTSGSACGSAEQRLCDLTDGTLGAADATLVGMHLEHCAGCRALARTLAMLSEELPAMAEIRPDPDFVADVMRATAWPAPRSGGLLAALRERIAAVMARPRFPIEAAYAGMLIVWLMAGASFSPLRGMPERALELTRLNPIRVVEDVVEPASVGRKLWDAAGDPVLTRARASEPIWSTRIRDAAAASRSLGGNCVGMFGAAISGDLDAGTGYLKSMGTDLRMIWKGLSRPADEAGAPAQEA